MSILEFLGILSMAFAVILGVHTKPKGLALLKMVWQTAVATLILVSAVLGYNKYVKDEPVSLKSVVIAPLKVVGSDISKDAEAANVTRFLREDFQILSPDVLRVQAYSRSQEDPIGQPNYVVEGSIIYSPHTSSDRIEIQVKLVEMPRGDVIERFTERGRESELIKMERKLFKRIVKEGFNYKLSRRAEVLLESSREYHAEANTSYSEGRKLWMERSPKQLAQALELFEKAVHLDTALAEAYSGIADIYVLLAIHGILPPEQVIDKAEEAAIKALSIDETRVEAHVSLGAVRATLDWKWAAAELQYKSALKSKPGYPSSLPALCWLFMGYEPT